MAGGCISWKTAPGWATSWASSRWQAGSSRRKRISAFYLYYAQLVNLGDQFKSSAGPLLSKAERSAWQRYTGRAERLRSHAGALRE